MGLSCPTQRGVAILGVCAWGSERAVETHGLRLSRVPPAPPVPPVPPVPHRVVCVEATERLCGSHTGCVAATQGLLLCHNSILWLLRSHNSCVGCTYCLKKLLMPAKQARIRPENIESGTNGVGKPPFGLKLCAVRAVPFRMPPACLDCQKTKKSEKKTGVLAIFGPRALPGPISPWMRCAAGWCDSTIYTCWYG